MPIAITIVPIFFIILPSYFKEAGRSRVPHILSPNLQEGWERVGEREKKKGAEYFSPLQLYQLQPRPWPQPWPMAMPLPPPRPGPMPACGQICWFCSRKAVRFA